MKKRRFTQGQVVTILRETARTRADEALWAAAGCVDTVRRSNVGELVFVARA